MINKERGAVVPEITARPSASSKGVGLNGQVYQTHKERVIVILCELLKRIGKEEKIKKTKDGKPHFGGRSLTPK